MPNVSTAVIGEVLQAPLPAIVERLGIAVAQAQRAMDDAALRMAVLLGDKDSAGVEIGRRTYSLLELGFTPTFYHFSEATVDAKLTFSLAQSSEQRLSVGATVGATVYFVMFAASVNASYTSKYSFEAHGSSSLTARIAAVPPPARLSSVLDRLAGGLPS